MKRPTLGGKIRTSRQLLKMTQTAVAMAASVSRTYVDMVERDVRLPSLPVLQRLAGILGVKVLELLTLGYPEIAEFVAAPRQESSSTQMSAWQRLVRDRVLQRTQRITQAELRFLSDVNRLGQVSSVRDYLLILRVCRLAVGQ